MMVFGRNKVQSSTESLCQTVLITFLLIMTLRGEELVNRFNDFVAHIGNTANASVSATCTPRSLYSLFLQTTIIAEVIKVFEGLKNIHSRDAEDLQIRPIK